MPFVPYVEKREPLEVWPIFKDGVPLSVQTFSEVRERLLSNLKTAV